MSYFESMDSRGFIDSRLGKCDVSQRECDKAMTAGKGMSVLSQWRVENSLTQDQEKYDVGQRECDRAMTAGKRMSNLNQPIAKNINIFNSKNSSFFINFRKSHRRRTQRISGHIPCGRAYGKAATPI